MSMSNKIHLPIPMLRSLTCDLWVQHPTSDVRAINDMSMLCILCLSSNNGMVNGNKFVFWWGHIYVHQNLIYHFHVYHDYRYWRHWHVISGLTNWLSTCLLTSDMKTPLALTIWKYIINLIHRFHFWPYGKTLYIYIEVVTILHMKITKHDLKNDMTCI